jgi:purine-binding chemotaxis protein CheW
MEPNTLTQKSEIQEINSFTLTDHFVVFTLDQLNFALPVSIVDTIVRVVEITPVPGTPVSVLGVINLKGKIIPVFNIRRLFGLPARELKLTDQLIIARTSEHTISFVTDMATGVTNRLEQKTIPADKIFPGMEKIIEGLVFFEDGMILIYNLDKLFNLENIEMLNLTFLEQEKKEIHDVKEPVEKKIREPEKNTEKKIKSTKKIKVKEKAAKTVKKKQEPKKTAAKRIQANVKKTVRTVARKPKGRRGSK